MSKNIHPNEVSTQTFSWGFIKWFVTPDHTEGANVSFGEVILFPEQGVERHNHPDAEEILYVLSGEGKQMLNDETPFTVKAGDVIHIPKGVYHHTINTGWEPLRGLSIMNPGGAEKILTSAPDFHEVPVGQIATFRRNES